jgi:hypothetical protein
MRSICTSSAKEVVKTKAAHRAGRSFIGQHSIGVNFDVGDIVWTRNAKGML